jgi:hypothetical protein
VRPRRLDRHLPAVTLLSRSPCGLCAEAEAAVAAEFGRERLRIVDITTDPDLEREYVFRVPVLLLHDTVLAEGRIERRDVRALRRRLNEQRPDRS